MNTSIEIQNLKCGGCAHTIKTKLGALDGIENLEVNTETNQVSFDYSKDEHIEDVTSVLSKLGYPITGDANPLSKKAKSFVSCAVGRLNS